MDRLSFPQIEKIHENKKKFSCDYFLNIQFPIFSPRRFDDFLRMIYFEPNGEECVTHYSNCEFYVFQDNKIDLPNLIEQKHRHLIDININTGLVDRFDKFSY